MSNLASAVAAPPIRAVIADDEPLARRGIRQLLAPHTDVDVVAEARNGVEALRALRTHAPTLLFLDVQMPELDGFGVLRACGAERMPAVVFVTAHDEFAVRAFDAHALDYLVKPLEEARFSRAMTRARERLRADLAGEQVGRLSALLAMRERDDAARAARRLAVPTAKGELILDVNEIDRIEADDYYAAVYARGRRHLIRESLSSLEQRLDPARFVRANRSAIVPVERVREVAWDGPGEVVLVLRDGMRIPVSRRRREQVLAVLRDQNR